ncbi:protein white-like isoform X2 [Dendronephthya gigantea]|nr:protein white-like isoform X2 [Dendronephthya gigantea]XP_028399579.1 protein white-like isoform X2 [Dendronephthya gigantea]
MEMQEGKYTRQTSQNSTSPEGAGTATRPTEPTQAQGQGVIIINSVTMEDKMDRSIEEPLVNDNPNSTGVNSGNNTSIKVQVNNSSVDGKKPAYDNVIANPGSANKLQDAVNLSWEDINVFVTRNQGKCCGLVGSNKDEGDVLHILKNVAGEIKAGSLVALMGSSGAGKSTLLNVLSHRNISSIEVSGTVFINGNPISDEINNMSAYVQQEDLFIGTLTVREHLMFQALLRMDRYIPEDERVRRVEKAITELGLAKCSNTLIGIPGRLRGISGGEKKRLSFASEILTDPPLLFVDEPTSGLDSFMAQTVVATLHSLSQQGKTILATIHQPSSEVYQMFDNIILLADGRLAYVGSREDAVPYFERIGYQCPINYNPADYFVQILAFIPEKEEESKERIKFLCDKHDEGKTSYVKKQPTTERVNSFETKILNSGRRYQAGWFKQFRVLFYRAMLSAKRDKMVSVIRIMQSLVLGVVVGLIYLRLSYNQENIQNFAGLLFFIVTNLSFASLQGVIFVFPVEVPVFLREHKNGMYRTDTYYLAKTLAEVPIFSFAAVLLITICYWMAGLREEADAFFVCVGIGVLIVNTAASYGYAISTMTSSVETATALGPVVMLPLLLFGGFFVNNDTVPDYFIWLRYLSWFNYGFEDLMINQWDEYPGKIECGNKNGTCLTSGSMILERYQLHEENFYLNIYYMVALLVAFRLISFSLLYIRARKKD